MQDKIFMSDQDVDILCDYEGVKKRGELRLLENENSMMLIVLVVVVVSKCERSLINFFFFFRFCRYHGHYWYVKTQLKSIKVTVTQLVTVLL